VLAIGSLPIRLHMPGMELPGVTTFRNIGDVDAMRAQAGPDARVVVIGGGLLGLEAAYGLAKSGARVTLVHLMDRLMERQLDETAAHMLLGAVEARGVTVLLRAETESIVGTQRAEGVELTDGRVIPADLVVMAVGVRPNAALAASAGLYVNRGIVVDDGLQTSAGGVYAIGECAEHRGQCYGLVEPAYEQAAVLARRLAGEDVRYSGSVIATNLKVSGVDVFSAGDFLGVEGAEQVVLRDPGLGLYRKLVIARDRLVGAVLYGDTVDALWYLDLIRAGLSIGSFRDELAFGRAVVDRAAA
jgi:nitrite reductase (NADH) large subunit